MRLGPWAVLAIALVPTVAGAQTAGTVPAPPPLIDANAPVPRAVEGTIPSSIPLQRPAPPQAFPTVIPIEGPAVPGGAEAIGAGGARGRLIQLVPDTTGLAPDRPPGPVPARPVGEVAKQVDDLIEVIQDPEAELSVAVGHTKLLETRRPLTRIAIANPGVADLELLSDQPNSRFLNLYGRSFGTTNITFWDDQNRPLSFRVRVTLDTRDLESRIKQSFPGSLVHVRQVGPQVILEGQVPDNKMMSDVLQLVTAELRNSGGLRLGTTGGGMAGGGMGGGTGGGGTSGGGMGGGMAGGGMGGGTGGGMGGGMGGTMSMGGGLGGLGSFIINRVHVPGPRQVLLQVKIAELNRTAIRTLGVSWLRNKDNSIMASTIGGAANIAGSATLSQARPPFHGAVPPPRNTLGATSSAANTNGTLFGIFSAGQFALFLDALRSNALAKILAEPNLMALDGQPAQFIAGGLFPYPVPQSSSIPGGTAVVTIQFAKFGAILTFLPQILPNDVIRLDVEPIFSTLNFGQGTVVNGGQVPAIDQRSARTVVELREGQTLAIAGLLQTTTNGTTLRVPGLGDLPIVGPWFSNTTEQTVETELVVLVTPVLVAPMEAKEVPEAPGDRILQPNDWEFYFLGRIEGKSGRDFRATVREMDVFNIMKHFRSEYHWVVGPHGYAD